MKLNNIFSKPLGELRRDRRVEIGNMDGVTRVRSRSQITSIFGFNDLRKMKIMRELIEC